MRTNPEPKVSKHSRILWNFFPIADLRKLFIVGIYPDEFMKRKGHLSKGGEMEKITTA